jgi:hypothetical protein
VKTERFGVRVERKCLDIVKVVLFVARRGRVVDSTC